MSTWTQRTGVNGTIYNTNVSVADIVSDSSGTNVYLCDSNNEGAIYISNDGGISWFQQSKFLNRWTGLACSSDGTKLAACTDGDYIYTSSDGGVVWIVNNSVGPYNWRSIASNDSGAKLVAVVHIGHIYTSTNYGVSWSERASAFGNLNWTSVASSSDGVKLVACEDNSVSGTSGYIYTSNDSGVNWTQQASGNKPWTCVASSSNGSVLYAVDGQTNNSYVYVSTNSGVSWAQINVSVNASFISVSCSADGTKAAVCDTLSGVVYITSNTGSTWLINNIGFGLGLNYVSMNSLNGTKLVTVDNLNKNVNLNIYYSSDSGSTWIKSRKIYYNFAQITSDLSGANLITGIGGSGSGTGGYIFISNDSGVTWNKQSSPIKSWYSFACDSSARYLIAGTNNDYIYTSNNYGTSWVQRTGPGVGVWPSVASNLNGDKMVAAKYGGNIYTSTDSGGSWTARATSANWYSVASNGTGNKLVACEFSGYIYTSSDSGVTWSNNSGSSGNKIWSCVCSDTTGNNLAATATNTPVYTSVDGGITWSPRSSSGSRPWLSISSNSTGQYLFAITRNITVFTSQDYGVSWLQQVIPGIPAGITSAVTASITSNSIGNKVAFNLFTDSNTSGNLKFFGANYTTNNGQACFNEGTKILCFINNKEEYIPIENLKKGMLVKSYKHGYRKIHLIGKGTLINGSDKLTECMYKMEKSKNNEILEDLIITGGHGIMVDKLTSNEIKKYKKSGIFNGNPPKIDDKIILLACISDKFTKIKTDTEYTYYHFTLDNEGETNMRYLVWANGILTETPSNEQFLKYGFITY